MKRVLASPFAGLCLMTSACLARADVSPPPPDDGEYVAGGEDPELQMGLQGEVGFEAFLDGAVCPIMNGPQGGLWMMPVLRIRGVDSPAEIDCSAVDRLDGRQVTQSEGLTVFYATDGWGQTERYALPFAVLAAREIDGREVDLECQIVDTDEPWRQASTSARLILTLVE